MPTIEISITPKQQRALEKRIQEAGKGSVSGEIRKALAEYLAGPAGVERAFMTLLEKKAPKNLPAMLSRFTKTSQKGNHKIPPTLSKRHHSLPASDQFAPHYNPAE